MMFLLSITSVLRNVMECAPRFLLSDSTANATRDAAKRHRQTALPQHCARQRHV